LGILAAKLKDKRAKAQHREKEKIRWFKFKIRGRPAKKDKNKIASGSIQAPVRTEENGENHLAGVGIRLRGNS